MGSRVKICIKFLSRDENVCLVTKEEEGSLIQLNFSYIKFSVEAFLMHHDEDEKKDKTIDD